MKYFLDKNPFNFLEDVLDFKSGVMRVDVKENDDNYIIEAELPGFKKENINIDYKEGYLTISATMDEKTEDTTHKFVTKERYYGNYVRKFYVGEVDIETIEAQLDNGVLTITLPKEIKKEETKKTIVIK